MKTFFVRYNKDKIWTFLFRLFSQESYERAKAILKAHSKEHKLLAEALLKYETLDIEDIKSILNNSEVPAKS